MKNIKILRIRRCTSMMLKRFKNMTSIKFFLTFDGGAAVWWRANYYFNDGIR